MARRSYYQKTRRIKKCLDIENLEELLLSVKRC